MSTVRWDSDMTGAVRQAADAFMQLQWRRLASNQGRSDLTVPSEWSEFIFDSLRKINDDLEYVPPMWRLCSTVLRCIEVGIQAPATELYLSWHSLANGSQDFYRGVEADISDGANYLDWSHVSRTVLDLVLLGDLSRAGVLAVHAATLARSMEPFTHEQEAVLADIFNLFVDPFTTQAAFLLWRERASQIMFDARHVLDGETDDNPTNIVKQLAFDMLTLATGSTDFLMDLLDRLQLNAFWYVGGIAAVIDPFAPLPRLAAAFRETNAQSDWQFKVGQAALDVTALHDLVGVASIVMELETDSPHTELAKLLLAVHLADIAAPPFVDVGVRGEIVSKRNRIAVQYVRHLRSRCPVLWRLGALYLTYSPMADPQELADHLTHAAAQQHAGRQNVAAVRSYIREFCDSTAPQQQTLRRALQVRLGTNTTAIATLQGVLANFDFVIRQALSVITDAEAKARLQGGELSTAVATWLDGGLHAPAAAAVMERLRSWSKVLHPDKPTLWDRQILDVGIALRSQQIVVHPSVPQDMVQLRSSLRLCELLVDVVPCSTVDGRAASSSGALEAACQSASMASRVAADLELPLAAFFLAATAANCCAPDERQTVLRDLHAAVATAAMRCPPHRREPGHALGHERVVRLLYGLAAATD